MACRELYCTGGVKGSAAAKFFRLYYFLDDQEAWGQCYINKSVFFFFFFFFSISVILSEFSALLRTEFDPARGCTQKCVRFVSHAFPSRIL